MSVALLEATFPSTVLPRAEIFTFPPNLGQIDRYPVPEQATEFREWFEREGYIVVRGAVLARLCKAGVQAFQREVLPDTKGFFERHASGLYERHVINKQGYMQYPIMNLQDMSEKRYGRFKRAGLHLLTQPGLQKVVSLLLGEPGRLVHSMYFDGNQTTWAHRDGHYIDSKNAGGMIGLWVAAEDVHPDAGRFFILPRSHRIAVPGEDIDPNSDAYKKIMARFVSEGPLDCIAPVLRRGDVLIWNSFIVHGSLPTTDERYARRSFTAHYVPCSHEFQWNVKSSTSKRSVMMNNVEIILHRDDSTWAKRLRNYIRAEWPDLYGVAVTMKRNVRPLNQQKYS